MSSAQAIATDPLAGNIAESETLERLRPLQVLVQNITDKLASDTQAHVQKERGLRAEEKAKLDGLHDNMRAAAMAVNGNAAKLESLATLERATQTNIDNGALAVVEATHAL